MGRHWDKAARVGSALQDVSRFDSANQRVCRSGGFGFGGLLCPIKGEAKMNACPAPRWHLERSLGVPGKVLHHMWVLSRLERYCRRIRNQFFRNDFFWCCLYCWYYLLLCPPVLYRGSHFNLFTCAFFKKSQAY